MDTELIGQYGLRKEGKKIAMICLVSKELAPNILGALQFRPQKVFLLHTDKPDLQNQKDNLIGYFYRTGWVKEAETYLVLPNDLTKTKEVCLKINKQIKNGGFRLLINSTGGTKPMSLGAFLAAMETGDLIFYVDTDNDSILWLNKPLEKPITPLPRFKIQDFLASNGMTVEEDITSFAMQNKEHLYPLALMVANNFYNWKETIDWIEIIRKYNSNINRNSSHNNETNANHFFNHNELKFSGRQTYMKKQCHVNILMAFEEARLIKDLSIKNGLIHFCFTDKESMDFIFKRGNMLELLVFYRMQELTDVDDVRIGVKYRWSTFKKNDEAIPNEVDVLASTRSRLLCFSCKSGAPKTEHLYDLETNAPRLGGVFVKKILVTSNFNNDNGTVKRAEEMGIVILGMDAFFEHQAQTLQNALAL